jgi:glutamyl-tRNA synthetase
MVEMAKGAAFFLKKEVAYDEKAVAKFLTPDKRPSLESLIRHLESCEKWTEQEVEQAFEAVMAETGLKLGKIGPPVRVALTGGTVSPGIYEVIPVLGKEETLRRLRNVLPMLGG